MILLNPYLNFNGNAEEAFNFYKSVFGGEFTSVNRFKDTPYAKDLSAEDAGKMMHISLMIGENMLMGTDALECMGQEFIPGNNFSLSLHPESKEEAEKLFNALSAGGKVDMPLADAPWGAYFGMLHDKFGIHWMVNCEYKK